MDKAMKSVVSGGVIILGLIVLVYLWKVVWFLAVFLFPVAVVGGLLWVLGNMTPKETHEKVENELRKGLDWMDFNAPSWTWPVLVQVRVALDWLGLKVKKVA